MRENESRALNFGPHSLSSLHSSTSLHRLLQRAGRHRWGSSFASILRFSRPFVRKGLSPEFLATRLSRREKIKTLSGGFLLISCV